MWRYLWNYYNERGQRGSGTYLLPQIKWSGSAFIWLTDRRLHSFGILAVGSCCVTSHYQNWVSCYCACARAGWWELVWALLGCCAVGPLIASYCRCVGQLGWLRSIGLSSSLDQWASRGMLLTLSSRLRLGTGILSLPKQVIRPSPKPRGRVVHCSLWGPDEGIDAERSEELGSVTQTTTATFKNGNIAALSKFKID